MKLISFAVVSFLAATVSAGFSETLGNVDYSVHRLEKRDPGEDRQRQLKEEIKHDRKHYEDALKIYKSMKHFEEQLETGVFEANLVLRNLRDESQKDDLMANRDMAQAMYETQQETCYLQYKTMMDLKAALYKKVGEVVTQEKNQKQLTEHNEQYPNDPWTVTPPTSYNEPILFEQVSAICGSIDELKTTRDELKATSDSFYYDLVEPGPDKETLREQSTQINKDLDKTNDEVWVNDVTCAHMTGVYTRLFAS
ncbi:hypothetical protein BASA61_000977 [Batrachochytrium salamandrivorans]|nr:hypothetical protein BASA61_000977 [Batrachochytrium salamandrivorans]